MPFDIPAVLQIILTIFYALTVAGIIHVVVSENYFYIFLQKPENIR